MIEFGPNPQSTLCIRRTFTVTSQLAVESNAVSLTTTEEQLKKRFSSCEQAFLR